VVLGWFDTTEVRRFAADIAAQYCRLRKSSALRRDDASKVVKKVEKLVREVGDYNRTKAPNVYKKAKMMKEIGNSLREQGVPEPEISAFVESLLRADLPIAR